MGSMKDGIVEPPPDKGEERVKRDLCVLRPGFQVFLAPALFRALCPWGEAPLECNPTTTLYEVLTPAEQQQLNQLWGAYRQAVADGVHAQFRRSRLFVEGRQVCSP